MDYIEKDKECLKCCAIYMPGLFPKALVTTTGTAMPVILSKIHLASPITMTRMEKFIGYKQETIIDDGLNHYCVDEN